MRTTIASLQSVFLLTGLLLSGPALRAQDQSAPAAGLSSVPANVPATASSLLNPALGGLRESLAGLHIDKWKAPGPVRQEANSNIGSITRDLDGTLPGLLASADAAPGVISQNLPVFRNVDALYDVLLRVVETADLSAPDSDTESLHRALSSLDDARRSLGDSIEDAAVAQEKRLVALQSQTKAQSAPLSAPAVPASESSHPAPSTVHKRKAATKQPTQPQ